jgi:hypothetical protein
VIELKERNMERVFKVLRGLLVIFALVGVACAANPRGTAGLTLNGKKVSVEYGRPSLHGRTVSDMLGQLGAGQFWRLGADKSTTFSTAGDLMFGDVKVPKGQYSLWAQKQADGSWKLVFNKQHGQWGTNHDPAQDLYSVPLKTEKESKPAEEATINLEEEQGSGEISIQWGDMELSATFK